MKFPKLVCPNNSGLLQSFRARTVAVRVNTLADVAGAAANVQESGNSLLCVIVDANSPLQDMEFGEEQKNIPLAILASSLGKFRNVANWLNLLRDLNLRIYLPCDSPDNYAALRILSSVGIHTCAVFTDRTDWEALTDLMTYAVLGRVPHASIEPFAFMSSHYEPSSWLGWGGVYFDDAKQFLHLDGEGHVALSNRELVDQQFVAQSIAEIPERAELPAIQDRTQEWKQYFLDNHPCSLCGGWKLCLGRFSANQPNGCAQFFLEMIDIARQYKGLNTRPEVPLVWQP